MKNYIYKLSKKAATYSSTKPPKTEKPETKQIPVHNQKAKSDTPTTAPGKAV